MEPAWLKRIHAAEHSASPSRKEAEAYGLLQQEHNLHFQLQLKYLSLKLHTVVIWPEEGQLANPKEITESFATSQQVREVFFCFFSREGKIWFPERVLWLLEELGVQELLHNQNHFLKA